MGPLSHKRDNGLFRGPFGRYEAFRGVWKMAVMHGLTNGNGVLRPSYRRSDFLECRQHEAGRTTLNAHRMVPNEGVQKSLGGPRSRLEKPLPKRSMSNRYTVFQVPYGQREPCDTLATGNDGPSVPSKSPGWETGMVLSMRAANCKGLRNRCGGEIVTRGSGKEDLRWVVYRTESGDQEGSAV